MHPFVSRTLFTLLVMIVAGCSATSRTDIRGPEVSVAADRKTNGVALPSAYRFDRRYPPSPDEYDRELSSRIKERWHQEIGHREIRAAGTVTIEFRLGADGQVSDLQVIETNVEGPSVEACKMAIINAAPFERWSKYMRLVFAKDQRQIRFTFKYTDK